MAATALKRFPNLNASIDHAGGEIVFKDYVHIGVAVDTDRGLLVPVIRDADKKNITEIAIELDDLASRARSRKLKPDEMQGGTFSISNLGGIGGTGFSPIVNWPEVAILGRFAEPNPTRVGRRDRRLRTAADAAPVAEL